jgi:hypothetical protein
MMVQTSSSVPLLRCPEVDMPMDSILSGTEQFAVNGRPVTYVTGTRLGIWLGCLVLEDQLLCCTIANDVLLASPLRKETLIAGK